MNGEPRGFFDAVGARWRRRVVLAATLASMAAALPLLALSRAAWAGAALPGILVAALTAAIVAFLAAARSFRAGPDELGRHLDRILPELEDSTDLLLRDAGQLNPLERLQQARIAARLPGEPSRAALPSRPLQITSRLLAASAALAALLWFGMAPATATVPVLSADIAGGTADGPAIRQVEVRIEPPAYTGLPAVTEPQLGVTLPEGSRLSWTVEIDGELDAAVLSFLDGDLPLAPSEDGRLRAQRTVSAPQVYYVRIERDGREIGRSPRARLDVIPDRAPALRIDSPEPDLTIDPAATARTVLEVEVEDDYGVAGAAIVATLARGAGEIVEFRSRRIELERARAIAPNRHHYTYAFDLDDLGLEPGSELYYHVEAGDNRDPEPNTGRTPAQRLRIPGGSGLKVTLETSLPILRAPEFFRSQRQIIIDTEKLLEEQDRISRAEFEHRSELLGFDQSALRMRYGALLGEEFVSGRAIEESGHELEGGLVDPTARTEMTQPSSLAELVPGDLVHLHDAAEINTFFDSEVKETLKAALAEMWDAEGRLRTHAPDAALPFEYRALKFLKEVQESQRIYVQKVGFQPPPLYPSEKRLTGELDDIDEPRERSAGDPPPDAPELRRALAVIASLRGDGENASAELAGILEVVSGALARRALEDPTADLALLDDVDALRHAGRAPSPEDLDALERAIWSLLPEPPPRPAPPASTAGSLFDAYVRALAEEGR